MAIKLNRDTHKGWKGLSISGPGFDFYFDDGDWFAQADFGEREIAGPFDTRAQAEAFVFGDDSAELGLFVS